MPFLNHQPSQRQQRAQPSAKPTAHKHLVPVLRRRDLRRVDGQRASESHADDLQHGAAEDQVQGRHFAGRGQVAGDGGCEGGGEEEREESEAGAEGGEAVEGLGALRDVDYDCDEGEADEEGGSVRMSVSFSPPTFTHFRFRFHFTGRSREG